MKQNYLREKSSKEGPQDKSISISKHLLPGVFGVVVFSVLIEFYLGHFYGIILGPMIGLPIIGVGGFISYQLEKFAIKYLQSKSRFLNLLPIIMLIIIMVEKFFYNNIIIWINQGQVNRIFGIVVGVIVLFVGTFIISYILDRKTGVVFNK